jgi:trimeric autotransporter adhesin
MKQATARTTIQLFICILVSTGIFAQSDNCAAPVQLTPATSCSNVSGSVYLATTGSPTSLCGSPTYDVWYYFTLPSNSNSGSVILSSSGGGSNLSSSNAFVEVYSGATCPSSGSLLGSCTAMGNTLSLTGLTPGASYNVRVFTTSNPNTTPSNKWSFNICVTYNPFPVNDECSSSTSLTSGVINSSGTVWAASASSGIPTGCATGTPDDDVWYSITVSGANLSVGLSSIGTNLSTSGAMIQVFSGTCGSLTSIVCGNTSVSTTVTNGATYYIRIYSFGSGSIGGTSSGSAFSITATCTSPPSNDECTNATTLTMGSTNSSGTVWLATASSGIPTGCAYGDPDDDVWYKFTATATNVSVVLSAVGSNLSASGALMQLFSGSCAGLTSVACAGTSTMYITGLTISSVYYIRVYSAGTGSIGGISSGSAFSITASVPTTPSSTTVNSSGRMKEMFQQTILSGINLLNDPWEITYGPDGFLWVTEAKGYKLYRIDPTTGVKITVLDISSGASGYLTPSEHTTFNCQFTTSQNPWPQGGFAGMALHPKFLDPVTPKNYVYVSYVRRYDSTSSTSNGGVYFKNNIVRFSYNTSTGKLESPVALCDTIPGSSDHNSQRMIIAPVSGVNYLFYGAGDMGAGQFANQWRPMKAQNPTAYEGKILRFNLEEDAAEGTYDKWIPNDNPYNGASQSAVWSIGMRNNQGFAYDSTTGILYGSSHGPYSDDELNIIQSNKNYGHPLVIGYAADGNYNTSTAGSPNTTSTCPMISDEAAAAAAISNYKDPLFSAYAQNQATIHNIWLTNPSNGGWPSEGWSGLGVYTHTLIPGWKGSLIPCSLKWGRVLRLKLGSGGTTIVPTNGADTVSYFGSTNRFRDAALAPNGKDMYVIMDKSSTTSGPSAGNPVVPACGGCVVKYTFLGYADASGKSSIPTAIDVTAGTANACSAGTTVTIDNTNNNIWVPLTGPDGNIMAEIYANGNNLGTITSSFYTNSGAIRIKNGTRYLDRNITITPQNQPSTAVKIRLYLSKAEFDALDADPSSGISSISDLKILKNSDFCGSAITGVTSLINPTYAEAHGSNGYMLQGSINSFSSFYFSSSNVILPVKLITFTGTLQNKSTVLKWQTVNEINASSFVIERSADGIVFNAIGTVAANNVTSTSNYLYTDVNAADQLVPVLYYRLKIVDIDGSYTYSKVIWVAFTSSFTVYEYPNPVHDVLNLRVSLANADNLQIQITDMEGKTYYNRNKLVSNNSEIRIDCRKWPSQLYLIKVTSGKGDMISIEKVLKL